MMPGNNILIMLLLGCLCAGGLSFADEASTLTIGVVDPLCRESACACVVEDAERSYPGLQKSIEQATSITLEFKYYDDLLLLERAIKAGKLDGMICKAWSGMLLGRDAKRKFERVADIAKPKGAIGLRGSFIVLAESSIETLEDLKGMNVAFGQENSYEKHYSAFRTLQRLGIAIAENHAEFYTCTESALALLEHRAEAAVISDYALDYGCITIVGEKSAFRIIGQTDERIPFTSLFLDTDKVKQEDRQKLQQALLKITGDNVPPDLFSKGWMKPLPWEPKELKKK
jgi:ABC-type phosphate/phosphonate transport system substrate-binding protein